MAYEIPQQLQHKEKIMFGLTFVQIGWAVLFGTATLLILISEGDFTSKFTYALFPAILGILFIFFDVSKWVRYIFYFFKFRVATIDSAKMQSFIEIKKIENNIIQTHTQMLQYYKLRRLILVLKLLKSRIQ